MFRLRSVLLLVALLSIGSAQPGWTQNKAYDLGHYPGGSWAELHAINDFGVAVGFGDVASGDTRMMGVKSYSDFYSWFESGVNSNFSDVEGGGISNTGIVAGYINAANGYGRAYAWNVSDNTGVDLGTLPGDDGSAAIAINNSGTLIVGGSYHFVGNGHKKSAWLTPVVWTLEYDWNNGQPITKWAIHALPTNGLEQHGAVFRGDTLNYWEGWGVNDLGQIVGDAWTDKFDEIAVVWNPVREGREWVMQQLPKVSSSTGTSYAYTEALSINNRGEIVGDMSADGWATTIPALWTVNPPPKNHVWSLTELGTVSGGIAWGINDIGDVVGMNYDSNSHLRATRWTTGDPGTAIAINAPGDYSRAVGVNNLGIAVGRYRVGSTGPVQAFAYQIR